MKWKTKKCSQCKEIKPIYEFTYHSDMKDKHTSACRECNKVRQRVSKAKRYGEYKSEW